MKCYRWVFLFCLITVFGANAQSHPRINAQSDEGIYRLVAQDVWSARLTERLAAEWQLQTPLHFFLDSQASLAQLCAGEIDLLATVTPPPAVDFAACRVLEMIVALDGVVLITANANDFLSCLTLDHLRVIYDEAHKPTRWIEVDNRLPDRSLQVYVPDSEDLTIQYFNRQILGEGGTQRRDIRFLQETPLRNINFRASTIGYVSFGSFMQMPFALRSVPLARDESALCINPTSRAVVERTYPLSLPIFWYVRAEPDAEFARFVEWGLNDEAQPLIQAIGIWSAPPDIRKLSIMSMQAGLSGNKLSSTMPPDFEIRLVWESAHDLDLGLYLPDGNQVTFLNPAQAGFHRIADEGNDNCNPSSIQPQERIVALPESAPVGDYLAFVQASFLCQAETRRTRFRLIFTVDGVVVRQEIGEIEPGESPLVFVWRKEE